jgi:hypothetical protein
MKGIFSGGAVLTAMCLLLAPAAWAQDNQQKEAAAPTATGAANPNNVAPRAATGADNPQKGVAPGGSNPQKQQQQAIAGSPA